MSDEPEEAIYVCFNLGEQGNVIGMKSGLSIDDVTDLSFMKDETISNGFIDTSRSKNERTDLAERAGADETADSSLDSMASLCYTTMQNLESVLSPYHSLIDITKIIRTAIFATGINLDI